MGRIDGSRLTATMLDADFGLFSAEDAHKQWIAMISVDWASSMVKLGKASKIKAEG